MDRWTNTRCPIGYPVGCPWRPWRHVSVCLECWQRWDGPFVAGGLLDRAGREQDRIAAEHGR